MKHQVRHNLHSHFSNTKLKLVEQEYILADLQLVEVLLVLFVFFYHLHFEFFLLATRNPVQKYKFYDLIII